MTDDKTPLETALADLEQLAARKGRPDRYHARALLVPLGERVREDPAAAQAWIDRIRAAALPIRESWEEAVLSELSLACAEHVHAVDARYLDHPNYDFDYTLEARARLEARLLAARALAFEIPETLARGVERADRLLAPYVEKRRPQGEALDMHQKHRQLVPSRGGVFILAAQSRIPILSRKLSLTFPECMYS